MKGILKTCLTLSFGYKSRKTTDLFSRPQTLSKPAVKKTFFNPLAILKTYSAISYKNKSGMKKKNTVVLKNY